MLIFLLACFGSDEAASTNGTDPAAPDPAALPATPEPEIEPVLALRIGWQASSPSQAAYAAILQFSDLFEQTRIAGEGVAFADVHALAAAATASQVDVVWTSPGPAIALLDESPEWTIVGRLPHLFAGTSVPAEQSSGLVLMDQDAIDFEGDLRLLEALVGARDLSRSDVAQTVAWVAEARGEQVELDSTLWQLPPVDFAENDGRVRVRLNDEDLAALQVIADSMHAADLLSAPLEVRPRVLRRGTTAPLIPHALKIH